MTLTSTAQPKPRHTHRRAVASLPPVAVVRPRPLTTPPRLRSQDQRHLIYHIWPGRDDNGMWKWNVEQLLKRIDLFDGVRTIGVAVDRQDDYERIRAAFQGHRIDSWIVRKNQPHIGEGATFYNMLNTLPEDGLTFYGHAKGTSRNAEKLPAVKLWSDIMYRVCLDQREAVQVGLANHHAAGCFKQVFPSALHPMLKDFHDFDPSHSWHFAGSFFWFTNSVAFARHNHAKDYGNYYQVELWPGKMFRDDEAYCLFDSTTGNGCGSGVRGDLYSEANQEANYALAASAGLLNRPIHEHYTPLANLTDKGSWHSYIGTYERLLAPYRYQPVTLLEIGVREGGSLLLWDRVLSHPRSRIIGVDLVPPTVPRFPSRVETLVGDALKIRDRIPSRLDIVIDDASHKLSEQIAAFREFWLRLKWGGLYVIEDIQSDHDRDELLRLFPQLVEVDLRNVKGRYDDRILYAHRGAVEGRS